MLRSPKTNQRLQRELAFEVDGTGTASITIGSELATLTDNGTGDYTLTFTRAFARGPIAAGSTLTSGTALQIGTKSTSAIQILTFAQDLSTATDADFNLTIIGWDTSDEYGEDT